MQNPKSQQKSTAAAAIERERERERSGIRDRAEAKKIHTSS